MKKLIVYLNLLTTTLALAKDGGEVGKIFNFGASAGPMGMGNAYIAEVKDVSSLYYNPSGFGLLANNELLFSHVSLFENSSYNYLGFAKNFKNNPGGWGLELLRLSVGDIEGRDEFNRPTSNFSYNETAFSVGFGIRGNFLSPFLSMGSSLKILNRNLANYTDNLVGADIGFQYGPILNGKLTLGVVTQNAVSLTLGDTQDKLPFVLKTGVSYLLSDPLTVSFEMSNKGTFRVGTSYNFAFGFIRGGYDSNFLTIGCGIKTLRTYQLDIAIAKSHEFGILPRVSLAYKFGKDTSSQPKPKVHANDYIKKSLENLKDGYFLESLKNMDIAEGLDIKSIEPLKEKQNRLRKVILLLGIDKNPELEKRLREKTLQAQEAFLSMTEYIEGHSLKAFLFAQSAAGYSPNDSFYIEYLQVISKLTNNEIIKDEILPREMLTKEKLKKASIAFYNKNYTFAMQQLEEVILIDERNANAWSKLGSIYYLLGDKQKAHDCYLKAIEFDPTDEVTKKFLNDNKYWK